MDTFSHHAALRSIARVVHETTPHTEPKQALHDTAALLRSGRVLVITGAGVSTDSGIPDYRGPRGSLRRHRPMTYQEFRFDPDALKRYWARSYIGWRHMNEATPNRTHYALVELERAGLLSGIVTQNVDGLHQQAGSCSVVPIHGTLSQVKCLDCGEIEERTKLDQRLGHLNRNYSPSYDQAAVNPDGDVFLPESEIKAFTLAGCWNCGSTVLKPDVVYFGEPVPTDRKRAVRTLLEASDSVLAVGTSLAVMSGYRIALDAIKAGKPLAVINGGPGRADPKADVLWRTQVSPAFDALLDHLEL